MTRILLLFLVLVISSSCSQEKTMPSLPKEEMKILTESGLLPGVVQKIAGQLDDTALWETARYTGTEGSIDTVEEAVTLAFRHRELLPAETRAAFDSFMPEGVEGGKKLLLLWHNRKVRYPEEAGGVNAALSELRKEFDISRQEYESLVRDAISEKWKKAATKCKCRSGPSDLKHLSEYYLFLHRRDLVDLVEYISSHPDAACYEECISHFDMSVYREIRKNSLRGD